jgi:pRiA4b ORF-3-like protein
MPKTSKFPEPRIYQLKITIKNIRPPVWRRVRVPGNVTFLRLHDIIQDAFGWTDSHLHEFIVDEVHYGNPEDYEEYLDDFRSSNEERSILQRVVRRAGKRFAYVYDFGDDWRHEILVEKVEAAGPADRKPICVGGRRKCPPEDCGGPWGFAELLNAIRDPEHDRHEELLEWVGGEFDPAEFSVEDANKALSVERPKRDHGVDWIQ